VVHGLRDAAPVVRVPAGKRDRVLTLLDVILAHRAHRHRGLWLRRHSPAATPPRHHPALGEPDEQKHGDQRTNDDEHELPPPVWAERPHNGAAGIIWVIDVVRARLDCATHPIPCSRCLKLPCKET